MRDYRSERFPDDAEVGLSLPNLADLMLVFATGLIAALAAASDTSQVRQEVETMENVEVPADVAAANGTGLESAGRAFRDPETGKLYIIK